jgi:hypothetical protein
VRPPARRTGLLLTGAVLAVLAGTASGAYPGTGYAGSLASQTPTDEAVAAATCDSVDHGTALEEAQSGASLPGLKGGRGYLGSNAAVPVVGFLDRTTASCGQTVGVRLSGTGTVRLKAYRVGWYGGRGSRLVWPGPRVAAHQQPAPTLDPTTLMNDTSWSQTTSFTVPPAWAPGMYLVVVTPLRGGDGVGNGSMMPLLVTAKTAAPVLAVASTLSWTAYNDFGGYSSYHGPRSSPARSVVASLDRPLTGGGLHHLIVHDIPLVRYLGRIGQDVDWTTDDQLDTQPSLAGGYRAVLFPGHSEYWTVRMYDGIEAARNHGVNLAWFGADSVYWQTRLLPSPLGPRRRMVIYRDAEKDPATEDSPRNATVRWRDEPLDRDETELIGTTYAFGGIHAGMQVEDAPDWLLAGTGLTKGSPLPDVAANEVDRLVDDEVSTPPNLQVVLRGAFSSVGRGVGDFAAVYYTVPGGGAVFAAGTTAWVCDLDASCPFGPVPAATSTAVRAISKNVLDAFSTSGFSVQHPSQRSAPLPLMVFWNQLPQQLRGVGGDYDSETGIDED